MSGVWFICPSCDYPCWELQDGVCKGCFYCLTGGDLGHGIYPALTMYLATDDKSEPTAWWCR